jgi:hypothetical protein|tara:strand:+ start:343 stop:486 length:144 start_codon:yes stop_codon:yes gene_type:complete
MTKEAALEVLSTIKENINTCCAVTMDPDDVLVLVDILEEYIKDFEVK